MLYISDCVCIRPIFIASYLCASLYGSHPPLKRHSLDRFVHSSRTIRLCGQLLNCPETCGTRSAERNEIGLSTAETMYLQVNRARRAVPEWRYVRIFARDRRYDTYIAILASRDSHTRLRFKRSCILHPSKRCCLLPERRVA